MPEPGAWCDEDRDAKEGEDNKHCQQRGRRQAWTKMGRAVTGVQDEDGGVLASSADDIARRLQGEEGEREREREANAAARVSGVEDEDTVEASSRRAAGGFYTGRAATRDGNG